MSTQGRVFRWQRFDLTETSGIAALASGDAGASDSRAEFLRAVFGPAAIAATPLSSISCCEWRSRHGFDESQPAGSFLSEPGKAGDSFPAFPGSDTGSGYGAGSPPKQLRLDSPFLICVSLLHSASPRVPMGNRPGTERQYGQGNLYFKHAARNAACDFGRRPAR